MSHARGKIVLLIAAVAGIAGAVGASRAPADDAVQPLPMSHARHIDKQIKCRACHQGVEGQALASFPTLADCMDCHKTPQGQEASEPTVRAFAARNQEVKWVRWNRLAGHVYFSHAAHVTLAEMKCEQCHRDMSAVNEPVSAADIEAEMSDCVACHRSRKASLDCLACHK